MRNFLVEGPWPHQEQVLAYLRSGLILGVTMGADLTDWLDPSHKANPVIDGRPEGRTTERTDGTWFWYAGLIYFIERYNLSVPEEFIQHAARAGWRVDRERIPPAVYDCSYLGDTPASVDRPPPAP
jgi:hypothetical protein